MKYLLAIVLTSLFLAGCPGFGAHTIPSCNHRDECKTDWCCKFHGQCRYDPKVGTCAPRNENDCLQSKLCGVNGRCGYNRQAGTCEARNSSDCRQSSNCVSFGRCKAVGTSRSTKKSDYNIFTYPDGSRVTYKRVTTIKKHFRRCIVASSADCAASTWCKTNGACTYAHLPHNRTLDFMFQCAPSKSDHCAQSERCRKDGIYCIYEKFKPILDVDKAEVARRRAFGSGGLPPLPGRCANESDASCRASRPCKTKGECFKSKYTAFCVARKDADCKVSTQCAEDGHCTLVGSSCDAADDKDCRRSENCRTEGDCKEVNGWCRGGTNADCRAALICKTAGRCAAAEVVAVGWKTCVGSSPENCRAADECKTKGTCVYEKDEFCGVTPESCQESTECKTHGRCYPSKNMGKCVKRQAKTHSTLNFTYAQNRAHAYCSLTRRHATTH
jgi:hypothetical protein